MIFDFSALRTVTYGTMLWAALSFWACWVVSHWFYNLFLHPLRKVPGPRLAAMSSCYEFYYDVYQSGIYLKEIKRLHSIYGQ